MSAWRGAGCFPPCENKAGRLKPAADVASRPVRVGGFPRAAHRSIFWWGPTGWACSSVVEHCVDIAGVASSILATPTIFSAENGDFDGPDRCRIAHDFACFEHDFACGLGKYWASPRLNENPKRLLTNNNFGKLFTRTRPEHTSKLGKALLRKRRARLHEFVETVRSQISSPREVLGWGSVGADQRTCPMDRIKDPTRAGSDQRAGAVSLEQCSGPSFILASQASPSIESEASCACPPTLVGGPVLLNVRTRGGFATDPPWALGGRHPLLSPDDVMSRLNVKSVDAPRFVRRLFEKHGLPWTCVNGNVRATESQFAQLVERMSCLPFVNVGKTKSSLSAANSALTLCLPS